MATNKNAMARYRALDKCFSSRTRKYYMNDLIEACRMALERQNGDSGSKGAEGVQRRQIFDEMNGLELMYGVIINSIQDGHKKYYLMAGKLTKRPFYKSLKVFHSSTGWMTWKRNFIPLQN